MNREMTKVTNDDPSVRVKYKRANTLQKLRSEEENAQARHNSSIVSTTRSKSPLQCAEMVFGDLTNMQFISGKNSQEDSQDTDEAIKQSTELRVLPKAQSFRQLKLSQPLELLNKRDNNSQLTIQEENPQKQQWLQTSSLQHTQIVNQDESSASIYGTLVDQLRQQNMILAAEKSNMLAELTFYKNELAKLCLRTGVQYPMFTMQMQQQPVPLVDFSSQETTNEIEIPGRLSLANSTKNIRGTKGCEEQASTTLSIKHTKAGFKEPFRDIINQKQITIQTESDSMLIQKKKQMISPIMNENINHQTCTISRKQQKVLNDKVYDSEKENQLVNRRQKTPLKSRNDKKQVHQLIVNLASTIDLSQQSSSPKNCSVLASEQTPNSTVAKNKVNEIMIVSAQERQTSRNHADFSYPQRQLKKEEKAEDFELLDDQTLLTTDWLEDLRKTEKKQRSGASSSVTVLDCDKKSTTSTKELGLFEQSSKNRQSTEMMQQQNEQSYDLSISVQNDLEQLQVYDEDTSSLQRTDSLQAETIIQAASQSSVKEPQIINIDSQTTVDNDLAIYLGPEKSPLHEKAKSLKSSHKALKEKLAKVSKEISQLSDEKALYFSSPDQIISPENENTLQETARKQNLLEGELQMLRSQLECCSAEEKKVIQELQATASQFKQDEDSAMFSQSSESFQLYPIRLQYDNQNPIEGVCCEIEMSQDMFSSYQPTGESDEEEGSSRKKVTVSASHYSMDKEITNIELMNEQSLQNYDGDDSFFIKANKVEVNDDSKNQNEVVVLSPEVKQNNYFLPSTGMDIGKKTLQFDQIIEEEHESESDMKNNNNLSKTNSRSNSSNLQMLGLPKDLAQSDFVIEPQTVIRTSKTNENDDHRKHDEQVQDKPKSKDLDIQRLYQTDDENKKRSTNEQQQQEQLDQLPQEQRNSLLKFEKLIKETQLSDEGSLLMHIQKNLEQIKSVGDYSHRFAQLQQQQSPSPQKFSRKVDQIVTSEKHKPSPSQVYLNPSQISFDQKYFEENLYSSEDTQKQTFEYFNIQDQLDSDTFDQQKQQQQKQFMTVDAGQTGSTMPVISNTSSTEQSGLKMKKKSSQLQQSFSGSKQSSHQPLQTLKSQIRNATQNLVINPNKSKSPSIKTATLADSKVRYLTNLRHQTTKNQSGNHKSNSESISSPCFLQDQNLANSQLKQKGERDVRMLNSMQEIQQSISPNSFVGQQNTLDNSALSSKYRSVEYCVESCNNDGTSRNHTIEFDNKNMQHQLSYRSLKSVRVGGHSRNNIKRSSFLESFNSDKKNHDFKMKQMTFSEMSKNSFRDNLNVKKNCQRQKSSKSINHLHCQQSSVDQSQLTSIEQTIDQDYQRERVAPHHFLLTNNFTSANIVAKEIFEKRQLSRQSSHKVMCNSKATTTLNNQQLTLHETLQNQDTIFDDKFVAKKDLSSSRRVKMKKSSSAARIDQQEAAMRISQKSQGLLSKQYGEKKNKDSSIQSFKTPRTTIITKPTRQQSGHDYEMPSSAVMSEDRFSKINIYKRNSERLSKDQHGMSDQSQGLVNIDANMLAQHKFEQMKTNSAFDISKSQQHHAISPSKLNLDSNCPSNQVQTPSSTVVQMNKFEQVIASDRRPVKYNSQNYVSTSSSSTQQRARSAKERNPVLHNQHNSKKMQTTTTMFDEAPYQEQQKNQLQQQQLNQSSSVQAQVQQQWYQTERIRVAGKNNRNVAKTKSQSCIITGSGKNSNTKSTIQNIQKNQHNPSPYQTQTIKNGTSSMASMSFGGQKKHQTSAEFLNCSAPFVSSGLQSSQDFVDHQQVLAQGGSRYRDRKSSFKSLNSQKQSSSYLTRFSHNERKGSGDSRQNNSNSLILLKQPQSKNMGTIKHSTASSSSTGPSYMQPIQQKFRVRTIQMAQEKDGQFIKTANSHPYASGGGSQQAPQLLLSQHTGSSQQQHHNVSIHSNSSLTRQKNLMNASKMSHTYNGSNSNNIIFMKHQRFL